MPRVDGIIGGLSLRH